MKSKIYTAQEMRDMAENITRVDVMDGLTCREHCYPVKQEVKSMLRYAAEIQERCEKAVESMHTQLMHLANEGKTTVDIGMLSKYFAHLENILRGDAGKEGRSEADYL